MKATFYFGLAAAMITAVTGKHTTSSCKTVTSHCTTTRTIKDRQTTVVAGKTQTDTLTTTSTKYPTHASSTHTITTNVTSTVTNSTTLTPTYTSFIVTATITIAPTTTTAKPPPDFTPIKSTIPASYSPRKRNVIGEHAADHRLEHRAQKTSSAKTSHCTVTRDIPKTVTVTRTAKHNSTITNSTSRTTVKVTTTLTTTASYAIATTTSTQTTTKQPRAATTTVTEDIGTVYETAAVATHFAACDVNNQLSSLLDGQVTIDEDAIRGSVDTYNNAGSIYDCCVSAIRGGYAGSAFGPHLGCALFNNDASVCRHNGTEIEFDMLLFGGSSVTLSNAYCGALVYIGIGGGAPSNFLPPTPSPTN